MKLFYHKCSECGENIPKITSFKSIFKNDISCNKCKNDFRKIKAFLFFESIFRFFPPINIFIFSHYINKFLFPLGENISIISIFLGCFSYVFCLAIFRILSPYQYILEK